MTGNCKDCKFARFEASDVPGSFKWSGVCVVDILTKTDGEKMKYHTIMQHFHCSNNRFEPKEGTQV